MPPRSGLNETLPLDSGMLCDRAVRGNSTWGSSLGYAFPRNDLGRLLNSFRVARSMSGIHFSEVSTTFRAAALPR